MNEYVIYNWNNYKIQKILLLLLSTALMGKVWLLHIYIEQ